MAWIYKIKTFLCGLSFSELVWSIYPVNISKRILWPYFVFMGYHWLDCKKILHSKAAKDIRRADAKGTYMRCLRFFTFFSLTKKTIHVKNILTLVNWIATWDGIDKEDEERDGSSCSNHAFIWSSLYSKEVCNSFMHISFILFVALHV